MIQTVQDCQGVSTLNADAKLAGIILTVNHRRPQNSQGNAVAMEIARENQSVQGIHVCVNMVAHTQIVGSVMLTMIVKAEEVLYADGGPVSVDMVEVIQIVSQITQRQPQ